MFMTMKLTRARAAALVLLVLAVIAGVILAVSGTGRHTVRKKNDLRSCEGRIAYLEQLGWECDAASETARDVVIPREFGDVMQHYNELQLEQGFDLAQYAGLTVQQYTYELCTYPTGDAAQATIYLYQGQVIAGDIHSTAIDGFMHALR